MANLIGLDLEVWHERVEGLLSKGHAISFTTKICKFDPHLVVLCRVEHKSPDLEDSLPNFNFRLATLESNQAPISTVSLSLQLCCY